MHTYTGGTFDLFHHGHARFLNRAYNQFVQYTTNKLIVGLNTDEFINRFKGRPPVMTYREREGVLRSCRWVQDVVPNIGGADSRKTIEAYSEPIRRVVIGSDWHDRDYLAQMGFTWEWLDERGIALCYLPYTDNISTTEVRERLQND